MLMLGCGKPPAIVPIVRGPGLPPSTLVAPFRPWAGEAAVDQASLLASGEHARGRPADGVKPAGPEILAPPRVSNVRVTYSGALEIFFQRDVCPRGDVAPDVLVFDPPVKGRARWAESNKIVFEPETRWQPATRVRASVGPRLCAIGSLDEAAAISAVHEPLRLPYIRADLSLGKTEPIRIDFSDEVELDAVRVGVRISRVDKPRVALPFSVTVARAKNTTTLDNRFLIHPISAWPRDVELTVSVTKAMRGQGGAPIENPKDKRLRTWGPQLIEPRCPRNVHAEDCELGVADARGLELRFRNALAGRAVPRAKVSPAVKGMRMSLDDPRHLVITGDFALGKTYSVTVPAGLRDEHGQVTSTPTTLRYRIGLPPPSIALGLGPANPERHWGDIDPATTRFDRAQIGITARRVKKVKLSLAAIPDRRLDAFLRDDVEGLGALPTLMEETLELTPTGPTQYASVAVDLAARLARLRQDRSRGAFLVTLSAGVLSDPAGHAPEAQQLLLQVSDLGLTVGQSAKHGHELRVASLTDGTPVVGATVHAVVIEANASTRLELGATDAAGSLHVAPPPDVSSDAKVVLVVETAAGDRCAIAMPGWGLDGRRPDPLLAPNESLLGHVTSERGIYRPGETIHVVAWGKIASPSDPTGRRSLPVGTELVVKLEAKEVVLRKTVAVTAGGKLSTSLKLPEEAAPGSYSVTILHGPTSERLGVARLRVEHFRTPSFMVEVASAKQDGLSRADFVVQAKHYSGEAVRIVGATVVPSCYGARPRPEDFGIDQSWVLGIEPPADSAVTMSASQPSMDQPAERVSIRLDASRLGPGRSEICGVTADLLSRTLQSQANDGGTTFRLYGSTEAVALRMPEPRRKGAGRVVELRALQHVGAGGRMKRVAWNEVVTVTVSGGDLEAPLEVCDVRLRAFGDARCRIQPLESWQHYQVDVRDSTGVLATSSFYGGDVRSRRRTRPPAVRKRVRRCATIATTKECHETSLAPGFAKSRTRPKELAIEPETTSLLVGERARIAIQGPWDRASGMLLVRSVGASQRVPFVIVDGRAEVAVNVDTPWAPSVELRAWVTPPSGAQTARVLAASKTVEVTDRKRSLRVAVTAPSSARVRETKTLEVRVTDASGQPVKGRVALWVTDSAALDLTAYRLPRLRELVRHPELGSMELLERYDALRLPFVPRGERPYFVHGAETGQGFGSGHGRLGRSHRARPPRVRMGGTKVLAERGDFRTTPLFIGDLATDDQGRVRADLLLPDNITEFRVLAVASAGFDDDAIAERFGTARAAITVTKPVVVTAALPRHLRPGDVAEVAAVVRNNQPSPVDVEVSASVSGVLSLRGAAQRTTIAPGADARLSFTVTAGAAGSGSVGLRADVLGNAAASDAVRLDLNVADERLRYTEDGTQGVVEAADAPDERAIAIPLELTEGLDAIHVEARVSVGRSPVAGLESAAASLMRFPYGCVEQLSSKLVPLVAVRELRTLGLVDQNPDVFVRRTIRMVLDKQRSDGGFGLWSSTGDAHDYGSAYATWVLVQAAAAGYSVPAKPLERALAFVEALQKRPTAFAAKTLGMLALARQAGRSGNLPDDFAKRVARRFEGKLPVSAFQLGVLALTFEAVAPKVRSGIWARRQARLVAALTGMLEVRGDQAGVARPALSHGAPMGAMVPGTAVVLMGLMALEPKAPIVHKLALGLLALRRNGRWPATQDNAYALVALARYAELVGKPVPVRSKSWVGTTPVLEATLDDEAPVASSAWSPLPPSHQSVTLQRLGAGPVHYQLRVRRMRAPGERPADRVLHIRRVLRTTSGPVGDSVVAGQILALDVELKASAPVSYVAIDIPLPAGLEPAIAGLRGKVDRMLEDDARARSDMIDHSESLEDRVLLFADRVRPGTHRHTVYVRAVTPGRYDFPAARAMAQYAPAVQGWSSAGRVTVVKR
jgi:alpha-2-macroglobulin